MALFTKKKKLSWAPEAENLLKKIPPFVVNFARISAEREAAKRGLSTVTAELLRELADRQSRHKSRKFRLADCFAKKSDNPLYGSFSETTLTNNHSSKLGTGIPESNYASAWDAAAKRLDSGSKKALYIHIPFCATRCKYCGFFVNGSNSAALERYTGYLIRELDMVRNTGEIGDKRFDCVYFGGGTPSDLSADSLKRILKSLRRFNLSVDCEITLEGRVSSLSEEKVSICREYGVNRYSLGVQSFNTALRRSLGRVSSHKEIVSVLQRLRKSGDAVVVIDQIYGLPGQTMDMWEKDIKVLFSENMVSGVDHYPLIRMPGTPLDNALSSGNLPNLPTAADRAKMFCRSVEIMEKHGAKRISLKHFALDPCERNRYNRLQACGGNTVPVGCGGGGTFSGYFFYQGGTLENYYKKLDNMEKPLTQVSPVTPEDVLMNKLAGAIQNNFSFSLDELQKSSGWDGFDLTECFLPLLRQYEECGILNMEDNGRIVLTLAGQFWNNAVLQNLNMLFRHAQNERKIKI